jgi:long-subunit acyl-CoA synthetase (AMP-forming)
MQFVGKRVRFLISGGVALPRENRGTHFYAAGVQIYQGYGLTESASIVYDQFAGKLHVRYRGTRSTKCGSPHFGTGEILAARTEHDGRVL